MTDETERDWRRYLSFKPLTCELSHGVGNSAISTSRAALSMTVKVLDEVETPEKRKLNGAEWTLTLHDGGATNDFVAAKGGIGMISYSAERDAEFEWDYCPEVCYAWVTLEPEQFASIRASAEAGHLPYVINVEILGMEMGTYFPDGSGSTVWNVKAKKNLVITSLGFRTALMGVGVPEKNRVREIEVAQTADVEDFSPIVAPPSEELTTMRGVAEAISKTNSRLGWVIALLMATVAAVLLK